MDEVNKTLKHEETHVLTYEEQLNLMHLKGCYKTCMNIKSDSHVISCKMICDDIYYNLMRKKK